MGENREQGRTEEREGECSDNLNKENTILAADSAVRADISDSAKLQLHVQLQNNT